HVNVETSDKVMNSDGGKDLRRPLHLVGLHCYVVASHLLVILLAKNSDDVECCASRQPNGDKFDWFGPGVADRVVDQERMSASASCDELSLLTESLREIDSCTDHG